MKKMFLKSAFLFVVALSNITSSTRCVAVETKTVETKTVEPKASEEARKKTSVARNKILPVKVKIDLSSPERTARTFVAAFSAYDFVSAAQCVQVKGNAFSLALLEKRFLRDQIIKASTVEDVRTTMKGQTALVSFSWTILESDGVQQTHKGVCEVVWRNGWRLVSYAKNDL